MEPNLYIGNNKTIFIDISPFIDIANECKNYNALSKYLYIYFCTVLASRQPSYFNRKPLVTLLLGISVGFAFASIFILSSAQTNLRKYTVYNGSNAFQPHYHFDSEVGPIQDVG